MFPGVRVDILGTNERTSTQFRGGQFGLFLITGFPFSSRAGIQSRARALAGLVYARRNAPGILVSGAFLLSA